MVDGLHLALKNNYIRRSSSLGDNFEEIINFTEIWDGPIQRFNNK